MMKEYDKGSYELNMNINLTCRSKNKLFTEKI